ASDARKVTASKVFRGRIIGWLQQGFRVSGTGLSADALQALRTSVRIDTTDRRMKGYAIMKPSGNAAFDAAVRAHLDGLVGHDMPPPPEGFDLEIPNPLHVDFACSKACN